MTNYPPTPPPSGGYEPPQPPSSGGWDQQPPSSGGWDQQPPSSGGWQQQPPSSGGWDQQQPPSPYGGYGQAPPPPAGYGVPPQYGYGGYGPGQQQRHGGLATASLVLGIIGFVLACIPFVNYVAYPLVVLAIIFGIIAIKWGKAKAGLILGGLGLAATIAWTVVIVVIFHHAETNAQRYDNCVNHSTFQNENRCNKYLN